MGEERVNHHATVKSRGGHKEERSGAKISYFFLTSDAEMIVLIHTWPLYVRGWAIIIGGIYFFPPEFKIWEGVRCCQNHSKKIEEINWQAHELHHDDTMTMRCVVQAMQQPATTRLDSGRTTKHCQATRTKVRGRES